MEPSFSPYRLVRDDINNGFFRNSSGIISIISKRKNVKEKAGFAVLLDDFKKVKREVGLVMEVKIVGGLD